MRIFVGYGYNPRDAWIEDLVFKLISAFGDTVVTGKEIFGADLSAGVKAEIASSDAVIGFCTRRDPLAQPTGSPPRFTTHKWVEEELATASNLNPPPPFVEVRETNVDPQHGMRGNRARIEYEESRRDQCLVALAQTLGNWHRQPRGYQIELLPRDLGHQLRALLRDPEFRCVYRVLRDEQVDPDPEVQVAPIKLVSGLAIRTKAVPADASLKVELYRHRELLWSSDYQPVQARVLHLQPEL